MSLSPGSRLGPYEVTALIGQGGMGEVYRARDTKLGRDVAIKVLSDLLDNDRERLARLQGEAQVSRRTGARADLPLSSVVSIVTVSLLVLFASVVHAQQTSAPPAIDAEASAEPALDIPFTFDGPPPPVPPAVVSRDEAGNVTLRATRVTTPIRVDGRLDEGIYVGAAAISDFVQVDPQQGAPATQKTDVWVFFDDRNIYLSVRCWDSHPERIVARELRRDNSGNFFGSDSVALALDTFYDRRNGVAWGVSAGGGVNDGQITNGAFNSDWNPVYDFAVGRFESGWTIELAVPFKTLRYRPGRAQIWGLNVLRNNLWKNEISSLTPKPASLGLSASVHMAQAATVVGLEVPPGSKNLEIKPYVIADLTTDLGVTPTISNDASGDFGVDVKYGLTQNLTADFTYNTDFAQVEADEQQVNLTRFSLFFPEKREFFLENRGLFDFGGARSSSVAGDTPVLFYTRRIGLSQEQAVPLEVGGRLTGRFGRYSLGLLNIQTGNEPLSHSRSTNFSVMRLKRDLLRRSSVGLLFTSRSIAETGSGRSDAYGVDGRFDFYDNLTINTYWARARSDGQPDKDTSYRAQLNYAGDRYGVQAEQLVVGANFNPETGFVRRHDMHRRFGQLRFSPRPRSSTLVRKYSAAASVTYIENGTERVETRNLNGEFGIDFHNGDRFSVSYDSNYEFLPRPFRIAAGVVLPAAGYDYASVATSFSFGQQRRLSGSVSVEHGTFFSGHKTTIGVSRGRLGIAPQFAIEPSLQINRVDLQQGSFTSRLIGSRVTYMKSPRMFVSALLQYNSSINLVSSNVRLRWEYRPGSELFVVYNNQRDTLGHAFPDRANRALIIKINRLLRF